MPELPEVQTIVRDLVRAGLVGRRVCGVRVYWRRSIVEPSVAQFRRSLCGLKVVGVSRRGKYVVFSLSKGYALLVHLRMTGRFRMGEPGTRRDRHDHVVLALDDGRELRFHDTRKFGRWHLVRDPGRLLGRLGVEPLERSCTPRRLLSLLRGHRRMLKPLLLDQTVLAGLGNIYVDEALWAARLHPCRRSDELGVADAARLHKAIRAVLLRGLRNLGTTLGTGEANFYSVGRRRGRNRDKLKVFRRSGQPCPRCGSGIQRLVVAQRSTHICPRCQTLRRVRRGQGSGRRS